MENLGSIFTLLIFLLIIVALFIVFRSVLLWFWKIDTIVELLRKNNQLLESLLLEKTADTKATEKSNKKEKEKSSQKTEIKQSKIDVEDFDKEHLEKLMDKLKDNEIIIQDKKSKKLTVINTEQYLIDKELHLTHNYKVIYKK